MNEPLSSFWTVTFKDIIQLSLLLVGGGVAIFQSHLHVRNRRLQSVLAILRYVDDVESRRARWFAYEHNSEIGFILRQSFPSFWARRKHLDEVIRRLSNNELDIDKFDMGINSLNNIAFLIRSDEALFQDIVSPFMEATFLRGWKSYKDYIIHRRENRIDISERVSTYGKHLEAIVQDIENQRSRLQNRFPRFDRLRRGLSALDELTEYTERRNLMERVEKLEALHQSGSQHCEAR